jgi:hypothetical protein
LAISRTIFSAMARLGAPELELLEERLRLAKGQRGELVDVAAGHAHVARLEPQRVPSHSGHGALLRYLASSSFTATESVSR